MKVIVKNRHRKESNTAFDAINVYSPKKQGQITDLLRELWEREYNSWDPEPDRERSWFEENHARLENDIYTMDLVVTNMIEMEVDR